MPVYTAISITFTRKKAQSNHSFPKEFTPPFDISVHSRGLEIEGSELTGFFSGTAEKKDARHKIEASVTDSQGLSARGTAYVTITAPKQKVVSSQITSPVMGKNTNHRPKDGEHRLYSPNGKLYSIYYYKYGKLNWKKIFLDTGKLMYWIFYEPYKLGNGYVVREERAYQNGSLRAKTFKGQKNGDLITLRTEQYKNSRLVKKTIVSNPMNFSIWAAEICGKECIRDMSEYSPSFSKNGKFVMLSVYSESFNRLLSTISYTENGKFIKEYYYDKNGKQKK